MNTFYNSLSGVTSSLTTGPVTTTLLSGVNLFIVPDPNRAFTADEITALSAFLTTRTVFFMGEYMFPDGTGWGVSDDYINSDLAALGSDMSIVKTILDSGSQTCSADQVNSSNSYTQGTVGLAYGGVSTVSGGTPLYYTKDGTPFVAGPASPVPLPPTLLLLGSGLLGLAGWRGFR